MLSSKQRLILLALNCPTYGREIIQKIQDASKGKIIFAENNIYPPLRTMEKKGFVSFRWQTDGKHPCKYYERTLRGNEALAEEDEIIENLRKGTSRDLTIPEDPTIWMSV